MIADIQIALDTKMAAYGGEIAWEGVPYFPTTGVPYVATQMAGRGADTAGIGPSVPRVWSGTYQLLVVRPREEGLRPAYTEAQALLAHFPRGLTLTSGSAAVIVERGYVGPSYSTVDWINVPVSIDWFSIE